MLTLRLAVLAVAVMSVAYVAMASGEYISAQEGGTTTPGSEEDRPTPTPTPGSSVGRSDSKQSLTLPTATPTPLPGASTGGSDIPRSPDPKGIPDISIAPPASSVAEGNSIYFKLTASSTLTYRIDLNVDVSETGDYLTGTIPNDIALAANSTVAWLILETDNDNVVENDGTVTAEVLDGAGYRVGSPSSADATVYDNDGAIPDISIAPPASGVTEGNSIYFKLTASSTLTYRIDLNVDVSETGDYLTGTIPNDIALAASSTVAWLILETENDNVVENDGTVTAEVLAGTGYTVGSPSSAEVPVFDDEPTTPQPPPPPSNNAPTISGGPSSVTYAENRTDSVGTYTATDVDGDDVTWTLGGNDSADFSIGESTGILTFDSSPDYEDPEDVGRNNVYNVTVIATDDGSPAMSSQRTVTVTVTNVGEAGRVTLGFSPSNLDVGTTITATHTDPDGSVTKRKWQWQSWDGTVWSNISNATGNMYTVMDNDRGKQLRVKVSYDDGHSTGKSAESPKTSTVPLTKPQGLRWSKNLIGDRGILLVWQAVTGDPNYEVEVSQGGSVVQTPQVKISGQSAEVTSLAPGKTYTFRVRAWTQPDALKFYSPWSDTVDRRAPTPTNIGHQEDHTAAYHVSAITAAPNLPAGVPDPAVIIRDSIDPAVTAWNNAASAIAGKNLKICEIVDPNNLNNPNNNPDCVASNHDRGIVTVRTVGVNSGSYNEACGNSIACVDPATTPSAAGPGPHLSHTALIIEEPAWQARCPTAGGGGDVGPIGNTKTSACKQERFYWTNVSTDNGTRVIDPATNARVGYYAYINAVMVHEFGHTLGLPDFYGPMGQAAGLNGLRANMDDPYKHQTPTSQDIAQLRAIYAVHESNDHH